MRANRLQDDGLARREFERILLIKPSSLGDVVHGLPVLHGLRQRYPTARIDWLINRSFAPLLQGHPELDELVVFDRGRYGRMAYSPRTAADFFRFLSDLRRRRYDLVIDLQGLFRSGFMARATGAPLRIGFADAREGATWFYTHHLAAMATDTHAVDRNYAVAKLLGFAEVPIEFPLPIDRQAEEAVAKQIREHFVEQVRPQSAAITTSISQPRDSVDSQREALRHSVEESLRTPDEEALRSPCPLLAVVPGARWATKLWPVERFAEVVKTFNEEGVRCVLLGGAEDVARCRQIVGSTGWHGLAQRGRGLDHATSCPDDGMADHVPHARCMPIVESTISVLDLSGQTSIAEFVTAIRLADAVLCLDSAAAHLAVALGKPVVCITGPTNPARTGPYRGGHMVRLELDCSPCYYRRLSQCPYDHRCMRDLKAEQVVAAVRQALQNRLASASSG